MRKLSFSSQRTPQNINSPTTESSGTTSGNQEKVRRNPNQSAKVILNNVNLDYILNNLEDSARSSRSNSISRAAGFDNTLTVKKGNKFLEEVEWVGTRIDADEERMMGKSTFKSTIFGRLSELSARQKKLSNKDELDPLDSDYDDMETMSMSTVSSRSKASIYRKDTFYKQRKKFAKKYVSNVIDKVFLTS